MTDDDPLAEATAARAPAGSGADARAPSPWELDFEWRDAPRSGVRRPETGLVAVSPARSPSEQPTSGGKTKSGPSLSGPVEAPESYVPMVRRPQPAAPSSGAWPAVVVLSMGLLLFVFVAWQYLWDEPRGSDDDLRPRRAVDQTPVVGAPQKIRRFLDSIVPPDSGALPATPPWMWDTPALARFFKGNGAALDNLGDLLEDADWHPAHAAWHAVDLGADPRWPAALALKQAECAYLARLGQEEAAFVAAIDLADLGKRLEEVWAWPSFYSRALEAQERSAQALAELLKKTRLPEETLRQFQRQFSLCQPAADKLVEALNAFYLHEKKLIFGPASGEPLDTMPGGTQLKRPGRLFFKPQATLRLFMEHFRRLKMEAQAPLANVGLISVKDAAAQHQLGYQPNSAGESYCAARMEGYRALPAQLGLARARGGLVVTLFAVRRCIAEQRTLPPTLESLRPRYLLDVPHDPFSASPLHYDIRRGWIWSVGIDLRSQGGAPTSPAMRDPAEPTVEIGVGIAAAVQ